MGETERIGTEDALDERYQKLRARMEKLVQDGLCLAFSGGVDSTLLLKIACDTGYPVQAVTFKTHLHPPADLIEASRLAAECHAHHTVIEVDELEDPAILNNPPDRCYRCKRLLFTKLKEFAQVKGLKQVADGTNADDLLEYRPGIRALRELGIQSPLAELGLTKAEVRQMAGELGLQVAHKPSAPCLATRLPYNTEIRMEQLERISRGEDFLKELGFPVVRLRVHGDLARLELPPSDFTLAMLQADRITDRLQELGFTFVTLDLEGFRSGCYDTAFQRGEPGRN